MAIRSPGRVSWLRLVLRRGGGLGAAGSVGSGGSRVGVHRAYVCGGSRVGENVILFQQFAGISKLVPVN